jgi:hypothetical protein
VVPLNTLGPLKTNNMMTEPGGFLQWDEVDSIDWTVKCVHGSVQTDAVQRLFKQLCGTDEYIRQSSRFNTDS